MDTNTVAIPPTAPQSVPELPKRLSPFRFLIPAFGAVFLTSAIELLYTRGIVPACSELRCLIPMLALYAVRLIVIPVGFAFIGVRQNDRARVTEGLTWFAIAFAFVLAVMMWATSWPTVEQDDRQVVISSFQECVEAGFPVMESYPRRCLDFVEEFADGTASPVPSSSGEAVMCTADAFQCPDGTWVGRTGPRCEFVCP